jgi:transposase-like protein
MKSYPKGTIRIFSEELKRKIVEEIESGDIGQCEASRLYLANRTAIMKWQKQYGSLPRRREVVEVVMKEEKDKIAELQQALADAHLKLILYDKMLELAGEEYKVDLKKNFSIQASDLLKGTGKKSKGSVE